MAKLKSHGSIDSSKIEELARSHPELPTDMRTNPPGGAIARGQMTVTVLRDDVKVWRGRLRGLRETTVESQAGPGLNVEARLAGVSASRSTDGPEISFEMRPGQGHVLGLEQPVSWKVHIPAQECLEVLSIHFAPTFIERLEKIGEGIARSMRELMKTRAFHMIELNTELRQLAQELLEASDAKDTGRLRIEGLALTMLAAFLEQLSGNDARKDVLQEGVMAEVDALIAKASPRIWTVSSIAETLGVSAARVKRAAVAERGVPIGAYLSDMRIAAAKAMLAKPLAVADIAAASGYRSPEAFSKAFQKKVGLSPAAYRDGLD
ncbi:MAG: helix-turn-helix transcriptional regulator [Pseudomonadota bacterium]